MSGCTPPIPTPDGHPPQVFRCRFYALFTRLPSRSPSAVRGFPPGFTAIGDPPLTSHRAKGVIMWQLGLRVRTLVSGMRPHREPLRRGSPSQAADWLPPVLGPNDWVAGMMADR